MNDYRDELPKNTFFKVHRCVSVRRYCSLYNVYKVDIVILFSERNGLENLICMLLCNFFFFLIRNEFEKTPLDTTSTTLICMSTYTVRQRKKIM